MDPIRSSEALPRSPRVTERYLRALALSAGFRADAAVVAFHDSVGLLENTWRTICSVVPQLEGMARLELDPSLSAAAETETDGKTYVVRVNTGILSWNLEVVTILVNYFEARRSGDDSPGAHRAERLASALMFKSISWLASTVGYAREYSHAVPPELTPEVDLLTQSMLYFILAHEMAHVARGEGARRDEKSNLSASRELLADEWAIRTLRLVADNGVGVLDLSILGPGMGMFLCADALRRSYSGMTSGPYPDAGLRLTLARKIMLDETFPADAVARFDIVGQAFNRLGALTMAMSPRAMLPVSEARQYLRQYGIQLPGGAEADGVSLRRLFTLVMDSDLKRLADQAAVTDSEVAAVERYIGLMPAVLIPVFASARSGTRNALAIDDTNRPRLSEVCAVLLARFADPILRGAILSCS